jgi:hypothetical protein
MTGYVIASYEKIERIDNAITVVMGSHTRDYTGTHTEIIKAGSLVNFSRANDGTEWVLFDYQGVNNNNYREFAKEGRLHYRHGNK